MARSRATNYDEKRRAMLDRSAELFAEYGYDRASMSKIAEVCGVSKANLYHYYKDKEGLLFDMIRYHLEELLEVVANADHPELSPEFRLRELCAALLDAYHDADAQHNVQINGLRLLPLERQTELRILERDPVAIFSAAVIGVAPQLKGTKMLQPVTHVAVRHAELALFVVQEHGAGQPRRIRRRRNEAHHRRLHQHSQIAGQAGEVVRHAPPLTRHYS